MRWRTERVKARWAARGWDLTSTKQGRLRTTLTFQGTGTREPRRVRALTVIPPVLVIALVGFGAFKVAPSTFHSLADRLPGVAIDSDEDGLPDQVETDGWRTQTGDEYHTNPDKPDSDGDGLSDGEEAGPSSKGEGDSKLYAGLSDPTKVDSDADGLPDPVEIGDIASVVSGDVDSFAIADPLKTDSDGDSIGDGDEFFLDMDPRSTDTDEDGLFDREELDFGSDPALANPDEDSYSDEEEQERGSNPLFYDLTGDEKVAAGKAGLKYGECADCAIDAGLRVEQVESAEYLAGQLASGFAVYGDFRDFAVNLWKRKFLDAGLDALGFVPYVGDGAKAVATLLAFAKRGDRAAAAVRSVLDKVRLPDSAKKKVLGSLASGVSKLPRELVGGPKTYMVYVGKDYVGITRNFPVRKAQHARAGRNFEPEPMKGAVQLSRGEARAIEQACIAQGGLAPTGGLQNRINSISPNLSYHAAAVAYGEYLLEKIGAACPLSRSR